MNWERSGRNSILASSGLKHASHELHSWVVSETQIERISGLGSVENGPTGASCYVGGLQSMSHYRFSIPFLPFFGGGRHQEEKEAALVDDSRCGRHRLIAIVGDESVCVLAPKRMLCY